MRSEFLRLSLPFVLLAAPASADVLNAGEILRVDFTVNNNFNIQPNTLKLNFGLIQVVSPFGTRSAALYDGSTLLGTAMSSSFGTHMGALNLDPSNSFTTSTSPWTFGSPAIVDFTSILNGTIQGRIEFSLTTGAMDIPLGQVNLSFIRATNGSGGSVTSPAPTVTNVEIVSTIGTSYCGPGVPNSTGAPGVIQASGSVVAASDIVELEVLDLPPNSFGFFLNSQTQGMVTNPGGSQGTLCLGGSIGRYVGPGQIFNSGAGGTATLMLSLGSTPTPNGPVAVTAGQTWNFQCWHRDANPMITSNFTDAVSILFQ